MADPVKTAEVAPIVESNEYASLEGRDLLELYHNWDDKVAKPASLTNLVRALLIKHVEPLLVVSANENKGKAFYRVESGEITKKPFVGYQPGMPISGGWNLIELPRNTQIFTKPPGF